MLVLYSEPHLEAVLSPARQGKARRACSCLRFSKNSRASVNEREGRRAQVWGRIVYAGGEGLPACLQGCSRRRRRLLLGRVQEFGALCVDVSANQQTCFCLKSQTEDGGVLFRGCSKRNDMATLPAIKNVTVQKTSGGPPFAARLSLYLESTRQVNFSQSFGFTLILAG